MKKTSNATPKERMPRDSAGSMTLEGGTGAIKIMIPCGEFLEAYKEDATFRVQTPESIDPERTNPHAPWVVTISDDVGSASHAISRVLIQSKAILDSAVFESTVDKDSIIRRLHGIKETLVVCEKVSKRVSESVKSIVERIESDGLQRDKGGRALNPFPQVADLNGEATQYLIHAKRAIGQICGLSQEFFELDRADQNFEHLHTRLVNVAPDAGEFLDFCRNNVMGTKRLIDLRNFQEHPGGGKRTVIDNFKLTPSGMIAVPTWYISGEAPQSLADEMLAAYKFLVEISEGMFLYLVMNGLDGRFPFILIQIDDAEVDSKMPVKYRLSIDFSKLQRP